MRVVVVGGGPKALFCLERLVSRALHAGVTTPVEVIVLDAAGPVGYRPDQPRTWRLNVPSAAVDAAWRIGASPTPAPVPSFDEWRVARGEAPDARSLDPFPPRTAVGAYLEEQWHTLAAHLPAGWTLERRAHDVRSVALAGGACDSGGPGWTVDGVPADEVLLATGHARDWPGALRHSWTSDVPLIDHVYPPDGLAAIPPGAAVVVRGAALTFIDVVLALTDGLPAARHPTRIVPTSRTGRFMTPKPDPAWVGALALHDLAEPAGHRIRARPGDTDAAIRTIEELAGAYLARATPGSLPRGTGAVPLATLAHGGDNGPLALLEADIAVASGDAAPDATWALGQAWRDVYPSLVAAMSFESGDPGSWARFAVAAAALEPVAFGPPLVTARRLARLCREGVVDVSAMAVGLDAATVAATTATPGGLVVVDAVLPPPGITVGLLGAMEDAGHLTRAPGRRAVRVDRDLACLRADGRRVPGLSAVGRPTEDVVLGNDTLKRSLHDGPDRWAHRILEEIP